MTRWQRALRRFGLGAGPADHPERGDPLGWVTAQLQGAPPHLPPPQGATPSELQSAFRVMRTASALTDPEARRLGRAEARRQLRAIADREAMTLLDRRVRTDHPVVERLVAFWSNHLCVSSRAGVTVGAMAGAYEREAIRPFVLGRFADMVRASAQHPAMLVYLDNAASTGPQSAVARRARGGRRPGLNENLARELLELHTLGVNGGYTQADVTQLARLITGWGWAGQDGATPPRFRFTAARHDPGPKLILGLRYGVGLAEGERALLALCRHPATATHIATKLARHFVADDPPPALVQRLATTFRETDGDLRAVTGELIEAPECWDPQQRKFRASQDWYVAALRAMGVAEVPRTALTSLRQLRHPIWAPLAPKGFGDVERDWADPDALLNRAELARTLGRRRVAAVDLHEVVLRVDASPPLRTMVEDSRIAMGERMALLLAAPEMHWR